MKESIGKYLSIFEKLRIDRAHGIAPHKPVMLLSVLQSYSLEMSLSPRIYITPELVALFKSNWALLVVSNHDCRFALPFYHLISDKFWHLQPKRGFETLLQIKAPLKSFSNLNSAVDYAFIDDDLFALAKDNSSNKMLQQFLLDVYFPGTSSNFNNSINNQQNLLNNIEGKILNESPEKYKMDIKNLINQKDEEEVFLRGSLFKREVPKIYDYKCCISGMKIDSVINTSLIDACHIIPFSESYDDTISNGIALCPNLHRAFDRGLLSIGGEYEVIVKSNFSEASSLNYLIGPLHGKKMHLPSTITNYPSINNFSNHRKRFNF